MKDWYKEPLQGKIKPLRQIPLLLLVLLPAVTILAAHKERHWQTGKVLDSERFSYFAGTVGGSDTMGTAQADG